MEYHQIYAPIDIPNTDMTKKIMLPWASAEVRVGEKKHTTKPSNPSVPPLCQF